jgi:hypothetical protein
VLGFRGVEDGDGAAVGDAGDAGGQGVGEGWGRSYQEADETQAEGLHGPIYAAQATLPRQRLIA